MQNTLEKAIFAVEGYGQVELRKFGSITTETLTHTIQLYLYCDLQIENPTQFAAPFKDKTNGSTTYEAGRNLEIELIDGMALVDFNNATNMDCAYSDEAICAMPLAENWLDISIEAGEKSFK